MRTVTTPFKGEIQVAASTDLLGDGRALLEQGYFLIGHSDFRGSHTPTIQELKWQAEKVNASYVLYNVSYVQTENGSEILSYQIHHKPSPLNLPALYMATAARLFIPDNPQP